MKTARWTMAVTAAALLTLPAISSAQTPPTQPPATPPTATQPAAADAQQDTTAAKEHLRQATAALEQVKTADVDAKVRTQVTELKRRLNTLERSIGANDQASTTAQANRNTRATANRGNANWGTEVAAIDKILTTLLGPADATAATGTTGTTGTKPAAKTKTATVKLDDETRARLTEVRTHITAFATVMAGGSAEPSKDTTPAPAAPATGATPPATATPPSSTATPPSTTTPPPSATPETPQTGAAATAQVDQDAARRHLTEARNTLSALTQLPAASQLTGEARSHVSQLISNFNELITTQTEWRASYDKVEANLTALLGPESASATAGAAAGTAGTAGAVGTSGAATVTLDPQVREKLVELRRQLNEFEKAAGGATAGGTASASASGTATTGTTPPAGATPPAATAPPAGTTPPAAAAGTTGTAADQHHAGMQHGDAELMRHVAAIEALLKSQDDSGGLTLTKTQVEQLRTHWAALRQILDKK